MHIADVSHFVRPKTPLDREAYDRATSVYLPDRVIPMLPEIISNSLASLQPDRVRYTKTAFIEFTPEGIRTAVDLHNTAIRSKRRFTYEEVDEYLADREAWRETEAGGSRFAGPDARTGDDAAAAAVRARVAGIDDAGSEGRSR